MRCFCSTACRKPPPSITAIRSPSTCAGTRKRHGRDPRHSTRGRWHQRYPLGDGSAKCYSIMTTGAASSPSAQPKAATISATENVWKNIANNGDIMQQQLTQALEDFLQTLDDEARIEAINAFRRCSTNTVPSARSPLTVCCGSNRSRLSPTTIIRITWRRRRSACCRPRWRPMALPSRWWSSGRDRRGTRLSTVFTAMSWPAAKRR